MKIFKSMTPLMIIGALALMPVHKTVAQSWGSSTQGDKTNFGKYWMQNNQWGTVGANYTSYWLYTYFQSYDTSTEDCSLGWEWSFPSGQGGGVKFYPYIGTWYNGLPVQASSSTKVLLDWDYVLEGTSGTFDCAWDIWCSSPTNVNNPLAPASDEIMIWTYASSQWAIPSGTKVATVSIDGYTWDVWKYWMGWNYVAFKLVGNTSSIANLNITDFTHYLLTNSLMSDDYITQVQAGSEITDGSGQIWTYHYRCDVQ